MVLLLFSFQIHKNVTWKGKRGWMNNFQNRFLASNQLHNTMRIIYTCIYRINVLPAILKVLFYPDIVIIVLHSSPTTVTEQIIWQYSVFLLFPPACIVLGFQLYQANYFSQGVQIQHSILIPAWYKILALTHVKCWMMLWRPKEQTTCY